MTAAKHNPTYTQGRAEAARVVTAQDTKEPRQFTYNEIGNLMVRMNGEWTRTPAKEIAAKVEAAGGCRTKAALGSALSERIRAAVEQDKTT